MDAPGDSRARIGPATATLMTVDPMSRPPARAMSPLAMAVVATEAISQGASPMVLTPWRRAPGATTLASSQDKAGKMVAPTMRARASRRQAAGSPNREWVLMPIAVENTRMTSSTSMP